QHGDDPGRDPRECPVGSRMRLRAAQRVGRPERARRCVHRGAGSRSVADRSRPAYRRTTWFLRLIRHTVTMAGHRTRAGKTMTESQLLFGVNIDPLHDYATVLRRTRLAESLGLDHALVQDHAYIPQFVETWTLLAALAGATEKITLGPNVLTTPFRLPAMIAKEAATFDLVSNGRLLLGLGAAANPQGI